LSSFYIGGMYLNDAFDRGFDTQHQPQRPIPSGHASARSVFVIGFGLLAAGVIGVALQQNLNALVAALSLAAVIVFYNVHHKGNPWSPLVMATCRVLVYVTSGLMLGGTITRALIIGSVALLVYLIGLTFVAKRGASGRVVGMLLAGICLVDATALVLSAQPVLAAIAALGYPITRGLHRRVAGT
jgi:4-hydroxybenzoate polyprenyltransferase